jgi:hypothetical protein
MPRLLVSGAGLVLGFTVAVAVGSGVLALVLLVDAQPASAAERAATAARPAIQRAPVGEWAMSSPWLVVDRRKVTALQT